MKKLILTLTLIAFSVTIFAQNETDALRFSQVFWEGTARTMAMGSSFSALGTDLSVTAINPAGLAYLKKAQLVLTMGLVSDKTTSNFTANPLTDIKYSFKFNTTGLSWSNDNGNDLNWTFGIVYNRLNDFANRFYIQGPNNKGSMLDYFVNQSQGLTPDMLDEFSTRMAYDAYIIDTIGSLSQYTNPILAIFGDNPQYGEIQTKTADFTGGMGEWDLSGAIKYKNLIAAGFTLGIVSGNYSEFSTFSETDYPDTIDLNSFDYTVNNDVSISGINFKFGILITPVKYIRFSAAFHSPTFLSLTDKYQTSLDSYWKTPDSEGKTVYKFTSSLNLFDYNITTPMRIIGGLGVVVGKYLALNGEYELVDYSTIRMNARTYSFLDENQAITNNFGATQNIRAGAEIKLSSFYFRGGYGIYGSPYKNSLTDQSQTYFTGGVGFRTDDIFFDLAYKQKTYSQDYFLYNGYIDEPYPVLDFKKSYFMMTLGVLF